MQEEIDEQERLFDDSSELPISTLNNKTSPYHCASCHQIAVHPVIPQCGHIYCWECLRNARIAQRYHCQVCNQNVEPGTLRTIFVQEQSSQNSTTREGKPIPIYQKPIKNASGMGAVSPATFVMQHNIERERILGGNNYFPPQFILALSRSEGEGLEQVNEEKQMEGMWNRLAKFLLFLIFLALFMVFKA